MKVFNRLHGLNGSMPHVLPVRKSRWHTVGWITILTSWTITVFLMGHLSGLVRSEVEFKRKTGYSTEQLNDAHNKVNELLEKAKQNGLRK